MQALAAKMAVLEGTEDAVVTSSGMAAIASTLITLLRPGDHLMIQACPPTCYAQAHAYCSLCKTVCSFGKATSDWLPLLCRLTCMVALMSWCIMSSQP